MGDRPEASPERFLLRRAQEETMPAQKKRSPSGSSRRKSSSSRRSSTRGSGKRDTVSRPKATMYAKRTSTGRFREMDDKGKSLAADRRQKAKTEVSSGYGDRGDQRTKKR
jgi:hypothetical protein